MKPYKKYKSITGVEYNFYVQVNGKDVFVSMNAPGSTLIVDDPELAKAIEQSPHFKDNKIVLASVVGDVKEVSKEINQELKEYPDVKNMGDAVEVLAVLYNVPESEITRKAQVLEKAEELGIIFPNYK